MFRRLAYLEKVAKLTQQLQQKQEVMMFSSDYDYLCIYIVLGICVCVILCVGKGRTGSNVEG